MKYASLLLLGAFVGCAFGHLSKPDRYYDGKSAGRSEGERTERELWKKASEPVWKDAWQPTFCDSRDLEQRLREVTVLPKK